MKHFKLVSVLMLGSALGLLAMTAAEALLGPQEQPSSSCVDAVEAAIDAQAALELATFRLHLECRDGRPAEPATITQ